MRFDWIVISIPLVAAIVCVSWVAWALHAPYLANTLTRGAPTTQAGTWGDSFGAFNALFGALGFSAIVGTLLLQRRSLAAQQHDQHLQRFDSTFFKLLTLMRQLRGEITYRYSKEYRAHFTSSFVESTDKGGVRAIGAAIKEFQHWRRSAEMIEPLSSQLLGEIYSDKVHKRFERHFGPYFRTIYTILYRISNDRFISNEQKISFGNLLRSQLTSDEIELAAFNALMPEAKDLASLLTEFRMLKYIPEGETRTVLERYYPKIAFEGRED